MADEVLLEFLLEEFDKFGVAYISLSTINNKDELINELSSKRENLISITDESNIALYNLSIIEIDEYRTKLADFKIPIIQLIGVIRDIKSMSEKLKRSEDQIIKTLF
ncbi:hypothetical protein KDN24_06595 [Bacillus sp. Bva_UNVM-123]|uniref:hypothetical protein n=1 Tax=Bacillus sp. Bva_UNVM-123 TaxID=2829798 RepID=UPI00391F9B3F